jgi:hypothetical protein
MPRWARFAEPSGFKAPGGILISGIGHIGGTQQILTNRNRNPTDPGPSAGREPRASERRFLAMSGAGMSGAGAPGLEGPWRKTGLRNPRRRLGALRDGSPCAWRRLPRRLGSVSGGLGAGEGDGRVSRLDRRTARPQVHRQRAPADPALPPGTVEGSAQGVETMETVKNCCMAL